MSSQQQFLKTPGENADFDTDNQYSHFEAHDQHSNRFLTINHTQGTLDRELINKKNKTSQ